MANLDSKLLVTISDLANVKARNMMGDGAFDVDEYIAKLISYMGGRHHVARDSGDRDDTMELDWAKLGKAVMRICHRPPTIEFMVGGERAV
jgi:non-structural maintenance of chromosomes element 4